MPHDLQFHSVRASEVDSLLEFIRQNPWPPGWPEDTARRFLTELSSSFELVFDVHDSQGRAAVGVLLDRIQNKGNHANLEILGLRSDSDKDAILRAIIKKVKPFIPASRAGFELGLPSNFAGFQDFASQNNLVLYYETFSMRNPHPATHAEAAPSRCQLAARDDDEELYQALVTAFRENVDTSIPDFANWRKARWRPSTSTIWMIRESQQIVAFLSLFIPEDRSFSDIRTIGVLPVARGKGLARVLIRHALQHLCELNIRECHLTVAVQNKRALALYRSLGFETEDHCFVYSWNRERD